MDPLALLALILFMATFIETIVEGLIAPLFDNIPALKPHKWLQMYIAVAIGLLGAFVYRLDILYLLGVWLKLPPEILVRIQSVWWFGTTLTGLAIGKGSNYIHDLIQKFLTPKPTNPGS